MIRKSPKQFTRKNMIKWLKTLPVDYKFTPESNRMWINAQFLRSLGYEQGSYCLMGGRYDYDNSNTEFKGMKWTKELAWNHICSNKKVKKYIKENWNV